MGSNAQNEHPNRQTFGTLVLPIALCIILGGIGFAVINDTLYYNPDSAHYLEWAQSLAHGKGFALLSHPEPRHYVYNAPLYPVVLAPAAMIFPLSIPAAKSITLAFGMLILVIVYRMIRKSTGTAIAAMSGLFLVFNPLMILYSTQVLSDIPFAAGVLFWFVLAGTLGEESTKPWVFPVFIAMTICCMLLREVGIVLLAGGVVWFVARKEPHRALLLLCICLLAYFAWFIRNEMLVGATEHPGTRNSNLMLSHFLTPDGSGMMSEFIARWKANIGFYGWLACSLLFATQSAGTLYDVVRTDMPLFMTIRTLSATLFVPLAFLTVVLSIAGGVILWKRSPIARALSPTPVLYLGILLSYPVADVRFLFPLLLLEIVLSAIGIHWLVERIRNRWPGRELLLLLAGGLVGILLCLPNMSWTANFVETSLRYRSSRSTIGTVNDDVAVMPTEFSKPFRSVMEWVAAHTDSSAVIGSHYAEAAIWAKGRKVIDLSPLQTGESFEAIMRDYHVLYVVSLNDQYGANEFSLLLPSLRRFRFETAYAAGDLEVYRVIPGTGNFRQTSTPALAGIDSVWEISVIPQGEQGKLAAQHLFATGVAMLYSGQANEAERIFEHLRTIQHVALPATYCAGVAAELASKPDVATRYFLDLRSFPQSGAYVSQAKYHLELLENFRRAENGFDPGERVSGYFNVALAYWELGFRTRALEILRKAITVDSASFPAYAFGAIFELQLGDTTAAKTYADKAQHLNPEAAISRSLQTIFLQIDSLRLGGSPRQISDRMTSIASQFNSLGLYNMAAEELLGILRVQPRDPLALRLLSDLYIAKERYAPAVQMLRTLVAVSPGNARALQDLKHLEEMWR